MDGRSDGAGVYSLIATLLYYYFDEEHIPGIKTLDSPVSEAETRDPVDDLPLVDLNKLDLPVSPKALNVMEVSGLKRASGKGLILKLMIPEEPFLQFTKSNDGNCAEGHGRHVRCRHLHRQLCREMEVPAGRQTYKGVLGGDAKPVVSVDRDIGGKREYLHIVSPAIFRAALL